jgi:hypothetical protein
MIKIDCYMSMRCGSEEALRKNLSDAIALEGVKAEESILRIDDSEARRLGLRGSPSVFINGSELEPSSIEGFS